MGKDLPESAQFTIGTTGDIWTQATRRFLGETAANDLGNLVRRYVRKRLMDGLGKVALRVTDRPR